MSETVGLKRYVDQARGLLAWDRRRLLTIGAGAATWLVLRTAEEFVFDTAKDLVTPEHPVEPFISNSLMPLFPKYGSPSQHAAFLAWDAGRDVVSLVGELCDDQRFAVIDCGQGRPVYRQLGENLSVLGPQMVGARVIDAPTPEYGRFVYERAMRVRQKGHPTYESCRGWLPGRPEEIAYTSLMLPCGDMVLSVGQTVGHRGVPSVSARRDDRASPSLPAVAI